MESETLPEVETKDESDDEDEEDEESGRMRFRSERKEGVVVRLADASKRRNIPETLGTICSCHGYLYRGCDLIFNLTLIWMKTCFLIIELSDKAKQDLMEFEEQERQKRQNRHGGRGRGGGRGGPLSFGLMNFRGGNRGRINNQRPPLMEAMAKLVGYWALTHLRRFSYFAHCCYGLC